MFVIKATALEYPIKLIERLSAFFIDTTLDILRYSLNELSFFQDIGLVALLIENCLEQNKEMFFLITSQNAYILSKTCLVLLS